MNTVGIPVEIGVFSDVPPEEYIVLTPLTDSFSLFADNKPQMEVSDVRISLLSKYNYLKRAQQIVFALLSALFAALTAILAKIGIQDVNSNVATAVRTIVVLIMSWAVVFITGKHNEVLTIGHKNLLFLVLSGIVTGLSWLCYYRALQIGEASKVIPIDKFSLVIGMVLAFAILKETVTLKTVIGGIFITIGTFVLIF
jgi:transporter family protein